MDLSRCVETLNLLGDENRIRLCALLGTRELRVTDLVRVTGISQSGVSTHLGRLREAGFVRDRREGPQSFYALALDNLPSTAKAILHDATSSADPTLERDQKRLGELDAERRGGLPEAFVGEMERHYSPGRTWQSLAMGFSALLRLGDVLDVGSGDGAAVASVVPHCRTLTCVDIGARMVEAASERFAKHAERPARALEECARVLRPGGRLVLLCLDQHKQRDITAQYGERHPGFSPREVRKLLSRAGLEIASSDVVCREAKKPHFQVILAIADKLRSTPSKSNKSD
jgi:ArsR family transcriptional regulator